MDLFLKYFLDIVLKNEFERKIQKCKKWEVNIRLYTFFEKYNISLDNEINNIINDINNLSDTIKIYRTTNIKDSNVKVFLSSRDTFKKHISRENWKYLNDNYGFGRIFYNNNFIISQALVYVDIYKTDNLDCQKHLLREEITQILGMPNDINLKKSIFNKDWECITQYSKFDTMIIKLFLSDKIQAGMDKKEIIEVYKSINNL